MGTEDRPKVWGDGNITLALGLDSFCLWIGTKRVKYIKKLEVLSISGKLIVKVEFETSQDLQTSRKIEESIRLLSNTSWVQISRY